MLRPLVFIALIFASAANARDLKETCTSYERATGTIVTDCREPGRKERHCESYTSATGTTRTSCR
jgi:hypothetical protein